MSTATLPPFPDDVPTHPLLVIDYELVKVKDAAEIKRLWTAGTELGFWYLKNHGVEEEANGMFEMATETMGLPMVEKMKYEQGDGGMSFGYKAAGANAVDGSGKKDTVQSINISTDDVLAYPQQAHRAYPSTVNAGIARTITPFVRKSLTANDTLLGIFNEKLGLPAGALAKRHALKDYSGSEARCTHSPALAEQQAIDLI